MSIKRYEMTDLQREQIKDLFPVAKTGRPPKDNRVIYTKPDWDLRLFTPVPRGTEEFKTIYKSGTGSERINNRILNDYRLHSAMIQGKKRFSFFSLLIGINIHVDARIKTA